MMDYMFTYLCYCLFPGPEKNRPRIDSLYPLLVAQNDEMGMKMQNPKPCDTAGMARLKNPHPAQNSSAPNKGKNSTALLQKL